MQLRVSDSSRSKEDRELNCQECIFGGDSVPPKKNRRKGRYCFKHSTKEERKDLFGAASEQELLKVHNEIKEWQKGEGYPGYFEDVLRGSGMCVWSWPISEQEVKALWVMNRCTTESGIVMPYPNLALEDHPSAFFEYMDVYLSCKSEYFEFSNAKRRRSEIQSSSNS